jgi:hypothetical protein
MKQTQQWWSNRDLLYIISRNYSWSRPNGRKHEYPRGNADQIGTPSPVQKFLLALASTVFLVSCLFGTLDLIYVRSKAVCVFGNGVSPSTRRGVCFSKWVPQLLYRTFVRVNPHINSESAHTSPAFALNKLCLNYEDAYLLRKACEYRHILYMNILFWATNRRSVIASCTKMFP